MADKIRVLLTEEEVNKKISEVAAQINKDYEGKEVHLICILKGGVFFTCELAKRLTGRHLAVRADLCALYGLIFQIYHELRIA